MSYAVKEIYLTLQGEGAHAGRSAVFCRFTACNLWNGMESGRESAVCQFCDTDFHGTDGPGGGKFADAGALAVAIRREWPGPGPVFVVFTGGEPALQLDRRLVDHLHADGAELAVETNGTRPLPPGLDWVCVSPKAGTELAVRDGDELKLVYPQAGVDPASFEKLGFGRFSPAAPGRSRTRTKHAGLRAVLPRTSDLASQPSEPQVPWHPVIELSREFTIEAAHRLPNAPQGHKCRRLHGHSFRITVELTGEPTETEGWVIDFADIAAVCAPVREELDHRYLNDIPGLENPTSEMLARWVFDRLDGELPALSAVSVSETCETACRYRPGSANGR